MSFRFTKLTEGLYQSSGVMPEADTIEVTSYKILKRTNAINKAYWAYVHEVVRFHQETDPSSPFCNQTNVHIKDLERYYKDFPLEIKEVTIIEKASMKKVEVAFFKYPTTTTMGHSTYKRFLITTQMYWDEIIKRDE